jgi:hypothetical protein
MQEALLEVRYFRNGRLYGFVYGHPRLKDGTWVETSKVEEINFGKLIAKTQNTYYKLDLECWKGGD